MGMAPSFFICTAGQSVLALILNKSAIGGSAILAIIFCHVENAIK
jgi:hypothetical protein